MGARAVECGGAAGRRDSDGRAMRGAGSQAAAAGEGSRLFELLGGHKLEQLPEHWRAHDRRQPQAQVVCQVHSLLERLEVRRVERRGGVMRGEAMVCPIEMCSSPSHSDGPIAGFSLSHTVVLRTYAF